MKNVTSKYLGVLLFLSTTSCSYLDDISCTLESFKEKRKASETVVVDIQEYRDDLGCFTSSCELRIEDIDIDEKWQSTFVDLNIISSKPLVIEFKPTDSIYGYIWYAETTDSVKYILSHPEVLANELTVREIEEQWFFVKRDWN
ncbi:MAG: hypothetical protein HC890_08505 [Chloroflexaceae bacterium]|nr:hypothetical protein [Chloroflexaceae bacterium]